MRVLVGLALAACTSAPPAAEPTPRSTRAPASAPPEIPSVLCPEGTREQRSIPKHGHVAVACTRHDGVRHGPYELRRRDASLVEIGEYDNGERRGAWLTFDRDGHLAGRKVYRSTAEQRRDAVRKAITSKPPDVARVVDGRVDFGGRALQFTSAASVELTEASMRLLTDAARLLSRENPGPVRIEVRVAASASPPTPVSTREDQELAQRRADAIADALGALTPVLLQAVGVGSERPAVQPVTSPENNRVELRLIVRRSAPSE